MYDYDRRSTAARLDRQAQDYQQVMSSLTQDVVKQTFKLVSLALQLAQKAVHGFKFNEEVPAPTEVESVEKPLTSLARWMTSRREMEARTVSQFAHLTGELAELTKFWSRPLFLNKNKHAEKVEALYKQMVQAKKEVVKAFRMSGAWQPTAPAF